MEGINLRFVSGTCIYKATLWHGDFVYIMDHEVEPHEPARCRVAVNHRNGGADFVFDPSKSHGLRGYTMSREDVERLLPELKRLNDDLVTVEHDPTLARGRIRAVMGE